MRRFRENKPYPRILDLFEIVALAGAPGYPIFSISDPASNFMISGRSAIQFNPIPVKLG